MSLFVEQFIRGRWLRFGEVALLVWRCDTNIIIILITKGLRHERIFHLTGLKHLGWLDEVARDTAPYPPVISLRRHRSGIEPTSVLQDVIVDHWDTLFLANSLKETWTDQKKLVEENWNTSLICFAHVNVTPKMEILF